MDGSFTLTHYTVLLPVVYCYYKTLRTTPSTVVTHTGTEERSDEGHQRHEQNATTKRNLFSMSRRRAMPERSRNRPPTTTRRGDVTCDDMQDNCPSTVDRGRSLPGTESFTTSQQSSGHDTNGTTMSDDLRRAYLLGDGHSLYCLIPYQDKPFPHELATYSRTGVQHSSSMCVPATNESFGPTACNYLEQYIRK